MNVNYCGHCGAAARPQVRYCRQCGGELFVEADDVATALPVVSEEKEHLIYASAARSERSGNGHNGRGASSSGVPVDEDRSHDLTQAPQPAIEASASKRDRNASGSARERQPRSSALALASGLEGSSAFGSRMMALLLGIAVLVVGVASLVYYRQSLRSFQFVRSERNLVSPEEQSLDLIRLGKQSHELGQYEKAIGQFKEALALTPQHLSIYLLLAQSYQASGQVDDALKAYWTLLRQDPRNLEARLEVAEVLRARGNWREAYQEYQRIIDINSQSLEAIAALAVIEAHNDRPYGVARAELPKHRATTRVNMAASLAPPLPGMGGVAALAPQRLQGNALEAPPNLLGTRDDDGGVRALAESHKTLGIRYNNVREYLASIRELTIAMRLTPGDKDLYYLLGSNYDGLDQDDLAHQYYKQCDSGTYAAVARSGALRTAKAARKKEIKKQEAIPASEARLPSRPTGHTLK